MFRINKEGQIKVISAFFILVALISGAFAINDTLKENNISGVEYLSMILDDMIDSLDDSYQVGEIDEDELVISENQEPIQKVYKSKIIDEPLVNESNKTIKSILATVVNGKNIFDDPYTQTYLRHYSNLSDVDFKNLTQRENSVLLKAGNVETKIEGFVINNKKYAIHLVTCNRERGTCNFRINGIIVKDLSPDGTNSFDLDENYAMKIKSIKIDYCDNKRICDYYYEAYDLVEIEVVRK